jgi:hypothetical protein
MKLAAAWSPGLGAEGFQHLALVIHGAPEIAHLAVDLHHHEADHPRR